MTTEVEVIPQPKEQKTALLHSLTFAEVIESKKSVADRRGYLVAGPDRKGANAILPASLWKTWQHDVQVAMANPGLVPVPVRVQEYFQRTKHLQSPPKPGTDINIYGSNPAMNSQDITDLIQGGNTLDIDLGMGTPTGVPVAPNPCQGVLAKPPRFATSFSGMESFLQCPFKFAAEKYYKTVPYEETVHTIWGNRVHKTAENYVLNRLDGGTRPVEEECLALVKRYCDFFLSLPGAEIHVEQELCCTKSLKPCGWRDWNIVWFRGKGDLLVIKDRKLIIPDWKTGKVKNDIFQIEVMVALADLYHGDKFDTADGRLIFVKEPDPKKAMVGLPKEIYPNGVTKADIPKIWEKIFAITNRMEQAWETANFRVQSNGLCWQYCGNLHCVHNGRR
ncbi:MAG: hypothetical protein A2Y38_19990 [Spirochaetes bacterium GWB1_59_5]|nr:MAG: hypothetical protein A2Y38_19990 [Spirochaetes bacterium GWB1_59_5]